MQVQITNLTSSPVYIGDIYTSVPVGSPLTIERSASDLSGMAALQKAIADGDVSIVVTPTADELASGLLAPPSSIQAQDMAPVAAADVGSGLILLRVPMTAGGGGSPDDITVYALNALPYKFRIVDSWAFISAAVGGATVTAYDEAAGAGTAGPAISGAATGRAAGAPASDASTVYTPAATKGLFLRRSDDGVAGEAFLLIRRES